MARSVSPRARSRFRRATSQSTHSTFCPSCARADPTPAVKEVLPVPPLPETTATHWPAMERASLPNGDFVLSIIADSS